MDGKCTSGCLNNSYGFDCSQECKGHCKNQTQCQQEDGSCPTGCEEGYSGMKCDSVGCEKGDSGTNCDNAAPRKLSNGSMVCSVNCLNKTCHPVTGSCTLGCVKGFGDVNCSTSCANCLNQACERKTATCVDGCIVGFTGQDCSFAQTEADSGMLPESQSWLWFTLLLIAMIGLMNIFLTIFLKRNAAAMKEEIPDK
ncbi:multiple epidermal growth factor domains protein 6 [Biomphalaria glabrata]|nr:multiple epidermal growth factor domains protein 6 [Biomphalaria glabrata]